MRHCADTGQALHHRSFCNVAGKLGLRAPPGRDQELPQTQCLPELRDPAAWRSMCLSFFHGRSMPLSASRKRGGEQHSSPMPPFYSCGNLSEGESRPKTTNCYSTVRGPNISTKLPKKAPDFSHDGPPFLTRKTAILKQTRPTPRWEKQSVEVQSEGCFQVGIEAFLFARTLQRITVQRT